MRQPEYRHRSSLGQSDLRIGRSRHSRPDPVLLPLEPAPKKTDSATSSTISSSRPARITSATRPTSQAIRLIRGVINAPDTGTFNPAGIPSPAAFQPGSNRVDSFISLGTRGYGSDRVNTHFSLRYRQDLTKVPLGSPARECGRDILRQPSVGVSRRHPSRSTANRRTERFAGSFAAIRTAERLRRRTGFVRWRRRSPSSRPRFEFTLLRRTALLVLLGSAAARASAGRI